ncbi:sugar ABC transporter ATP-binding protein [Williamsoniiplasma lucivorax]|uniref:Ribose transport system ATP-binding protein n=1 Tax=Williamsoniiplasma lucivorax TaxID=209274 RepID=A0A2S5RAF6_9MOLU|nr:sugar ABC transporter ATP-binding protein [Williamsoniiplasma lucivorax]PPE04105.1 ribose transport system ATP-binding protein [Williamsoniiplasma lucivorax]
MEKIFNQKILEKPLLVLNDIKKSFDSTLALKGVYLRAFSGKAMGILGENGAGKSTLMNILSGVFPATSGHLIWNGIQHDHFRNIKEAEHLGISIIHQEITCFNDMTVIDNIFAGHEINNFGLINYKKQKSAATKIFNLLKLDISFNEQMSKLTIAEQQMVEIAKAMLRQSKLIIFDEPTSSLSRVDAENLFKIILKLKNEKMAICYISHKLEEIPIVCDFITIIRDGNYIGEYLVNELTEDQIIAKMVGREILEKYPKKDQLIKKDILFKVEDLSNDFVKNINFVLYKNEILGFSGLVGARRTELFKSLIGYYPKDTGRFFLEDENIALHGVSSAIKKGIYYVTEDRKNDGLLLDETIKRNISLSSLKKISFLNFINLKKEKNITNQYKEKMSIKTSNLENLVRSLSGGNQQKVLLAKAFAAKPKIMIFDEPTRGVDVGSRREIYDLIYEAKRNGIGVIVISSDLPEVVGLCNRVIVMKHGEISKEIEGVNLTPEEVIKYAI